MEVIVRRFRIELLGYPKHTTSILFIFSDGVPTDGDPLPIAEELKDSGVYIVSCFLTNQNITRPRKLFQKADPQWPQGAKLMFAMASSVNQNSIFVESLLEKGWEVPNMPKLFVQANHPDLLNEFTQIIVSLCKGADWTSGGI